MRQSPSINLVKKPENVVDRFINWTLTVGRLVVIVTEVIALAAFLYRFSLDRQLIDLRTTIRQKQAVIELLKDNENVYRNLQNRLAVASNFGGQGKDKVAVTSDLISFAPPGLVFNNINIQDERVRVNVNVNTVSVLSSFVNSLKTYDSIESVSIDKIENRPSSSVITVSITAALKPNKAYENFK